MKCTNCQSEIPQNAKFCPNCGASVIVELKCVNGHKMLSGQKFCCECGGPLNTSHKLNQYTTNSAGTSQSVSATYTKRQVNPKKESKGNNFVAKAIATIVVLGIAMVVLDAIGGVPSYIVGGLCFVIIPGIWKFIDDM